MPRGMPPGYVNGVPYLEPIPPPRPGDEELAAAGDKTAKMRMAKWRKRDRLRNRAIAQQKGRVAARHRSPARTPKLRDSVEAGMSWEEFQNLFSGDEDDVWSDDVGVMADGAAVGDGLTSSSTAVRYVPVDFRPARSYFC